MNSKKERDEKKVWIPIGAVVDVVQPEDKRLCYACLEKPIAYLCDSKKCDRCIEASNCALCERCWKLRKKCAFY